MCQVSLSPLGVAYDVVLSWPVSLEWGGLKEAGSLLSSRKVKSRGLLDQPVQGQWPGPPNADPCL